MSLDLPVWRSMLFVPVTAAALCRWRGAARRRCDHPRSRRRGRRVGEGAGPHAGAGGGEIVSRGGADVIVRLNRPLRMTVRDLEAVIGPRCRPWRCRRRKAPSTSNSSPKSSTNWRPSAASRTAPPRCWRWSRPARRSSASTRSPRPPAPRRAQSRRRGFRHLRPACCRRRGALHAQADVRLRGAAAGIMPMGFVGTVAEFPTSPGFRETVRRSRRLGFVGACVIHPSQVRSSTRNSARARRNRARPPGRRRL